MTTSFTRTAVFTLAFALIGLSAFAQAPAKGTGKISGTIVDATSNQPVEFATVAINDPATGKPVDGTVADEKGKFTINKVANGNFKVVVSFIGYETYRRIS